MKLAIVRGHRKGSQGATAGDGVTEYAFAGWLAARIVADAVGHECRVFERPDGPHYAHNMMGLVSEVNAWRPDLVLSLHFNASPNGEPWSGTSALHWPSDAQGKTWAVQLSGFVARAIGLRNRGAKAQDRSWSKARKVDGELRPAGPVLYILRDTLAPTVLLETHFGSNPVDHAKAIQALESGALSRAIVDALPSPPASPSGSS